MCGGDGQRQPRADLRDGHQQLEEGELLGGREAEERLLVLADEVVREDRCLAADRAASPAAPAPATTR